MRVRVLDVGQGDATLIETDDGHAMLIDAGPPESADRVMRAVRSLGRALDAVVLTHDHADHNGAMADIMTSIPPARFLFAGEGELKAKPSARLARVLTLRTGQAPARRGDVFALGLHADAHVLAPQEPMLHNTRSDLNANSVVLRLDHHDVGRDTRFLFVGDAEEQTEKRLLAEPAEIATDYLKVAHHGSRYSSTAAFLDAAHPRMASISCGRGNDYGHPHREALARLQDRKVAVFRTDESGEITFTSENGQISASAERYASGL